MQLGMVGLGRMGGNIARRLTEKGHRCVDYDRDAGAVDKLAAEHMTGAAGLEDFAQRSSRRTASTTSTSARPAACGVASAGIA